MARPLLLHLRHAGSLEALDMIAQVRPLRPEFAAASLRHLWGVLLAGAPHSRPVATVPRRHDTDDLITRPVERATQLIPSARLLTVLTREQAARGDGAALPDLRRRLQPCSRGTAPEMFLAALSVVQEDAHGVVAALPADHLVEHGARLMQYVARAAAAVVLRPDLPVIVGAYPGSRDPEYAWVEPGDPVDGLEAFSVHAVRSFVTRPSHAERACGMLGTMAIVVSARTLLALGRRHLPDVLECLEPLEDVVGHPEETLLCEAVWESMPRASLCRDLLARVDQLGVVALPDAMTGEWVRPTAQALAS